MSGLSGVTGAAGAAVSADELQHQAASAHAHGAAGDEQQVLEAKLKAEADDKKHHEATTFNADSLPPRRHY